MFHVLKHITQEDLDILHVMVAREEQIIMSFRHVHNQSA